LILIFRELMSWDYYVSDLYYEGPRGVPDAKQKESYLLPTRTFWRPVYFDAYNEPNLLHPGYARKVRDFNDFQLPEPVKENLKTLRGGENPLSGE
jgi:hypothetical protein